MDATLLNRIGIVLNFLAGFMLAPELLGVERLKKIQDKILTFSIVLATLSFLIMHLREEKKKKVGLMWLHVITSLYLFGSLTIAFIIISKLIIEDRKISSLLITLMFTMIFTAPATIFILGDEMKNDLNENFSKIVSYILLFFMACLSNLVSIPFAPIVFILDLAALLLGGILYISFALSVILTFQFVEDKRFQSIIVVLGVIFFILGNVLQFVATFTW